MRLGGCRSYELVSPPGKTRGSVLYYQLGAQKIGEGQLPMQATPAPGTEGDAVVYTGEPFYESVAPGTTEYLSQLGGGGWSTRNLSSLGEATPLGEDKQEYQLVAAARGLTRFAVSYSATTNLFYRNILLEDVAGGGLQPLIGAGVAHLRTPGSFGEPVRGGVARFNFVPASRDFSRLFFNADDALLSGSGPLVEELEGDVNTEIAARKEQGYLYEWHGGTLSLVSVLPEGKVARNAQFGVEYEHEGGADLEHVVSEDGLRVFWSSEGNLYLRERPVGHENEPRTLEVAAGGSFLGATADGARVFFLGAGGDTLEQYDAASGVTTVIASEGMGGLGRTGEYGGLVGTGGGGEYVYFVDHAKLTGEEANAQGEKAEAGEYNMYVYEPDGLGGHVVRFIATLEHLDNEPPVTLEPDDTEPDSPLGVWARTPKDRTAEVSVDGRFVAFGSHRALTGAVNGGPEVFVFDAGSGVLSCASCDPSGVSNAGAVLPPFYDGDGLREQRYMLDDGSVFFTTPSALLPEDGNRVDDVYEWQAGVLRLISPGDGEDRAVLADVSENGSDVFFTSPESIVSQDQDGLADLYDARVGGGQPAVAVPVECGSPESCAGPQGPAPGLPAPSSAGLNGSGNPAPPPQPSAEQVRLEHLVKALKACRRKPRKQRVVCERQARRRYGAKASRAKARARRAKRGGR